MLKLKTVALLCLAITTAAQADPCGMVPPIYTGDQIPITRIGEQNTYVFYKDGVETFVIRPGFRGNVDEFGMLIPFPTPPAIRKVPDHVFSHLASAVDPPEVLLDLNPQIYFQSASAQPSMQADSPLMAMRESSVRVLRIEAVGMYEVAVLEAGSAAALKKWVDEHGYSYPEGMDKPCDEYVDAGWCFVAVKTKVGTKKNVAPKPAQRNVNSNLPTGSSFDGHVQGMGFRFTSKELVVPMRLSAFNKGKLRNIVYLLTDSPKRVRAIPEEYVVRQLTGEKLLSNVNDLLPLRVIGPPGARPTAQQIKALDAQRNPEPKNGVAKDLFAGDMLAATSGNLSLPHEEEEKELLRIGERLGLRGNNIDKLHANSLADARKKTVDEAITSLKGMTLNVVDGDFPREVLSSRNLTFAEYSMPPRRNTPALYDTKLKGPAKAKSGKIHLGKTEELFDDSGVQIEAVAATLLGSLATLAIGLILFSFNRWPSGPRV